MCLYLDLYQGILAELKIFFRSSSEEQGWKWSSNRHYKLRKMHRRQKQGQHSVLSQYSEDPNWHYIIFNPNTFNYINILIFVLKSIWRIPLLQYVL